MTTRKVAMATYIMAAVLVGAALTVLGRAQEALTGEWQAKFESGATNGKNFYLQSGLRAGGTSTIGETLISSVSFWDLTPTWPQRTDRRILSCGAKRGLWRSTAASRAAKGAATFALRPTRITFRR